MDWLRELISRCEALLVRRKKDNELDEELRAHIELAIEENVRRGLSAQEARAAALREFGGVTQTKESYRAQRGLPFVESLVQDARFALRQMRKAPAFTLTTATILTLGIGVNTAIFSVVHHILLEPLPFAHPEQLQAVWARSDAEGNARIRASGPDFLDYHDQSKSFSQMAEIIPSFTETWTGAGDPQLIECAGLSDDFFAMLGIRPFMGRFYTPAEYADLNSGSYVVSYRFWRSSLGADPHVIGRTLRLGGSDGTIVGVAPPLPDLFPNTDVWAMLDTRPSWDFMQWRSNKFLTVIGRLKPGVTPAAAQEELTAILRRAPGEPRDVRVELTPLRDDLVGGVRTQLRTILAAAALVLLVACFNIAALLSVRSQRRFGEMALRLSLGAAHNRLRQQLLVEGLVLTGLASAPGVFAAWIAVRYIPHIPVLSLPRLEGVHLDATTLLAAASIGAFTTLVFGLMPALAFSSLNLASTLRSGRADRGRLHHRTFSGLVIAEIACSVVLAVCAGLLLHSYWRVAHVDPGFEPDHMLTTYLRTNYYTPEGRPFWRDVLEGIATLPGVRAAALGDCTPGRSAAPSTLVFGDRPNDPNHLAPAEGCWTSADFFRVSGTPLLRGRFFNAHDNADSAPVIIVNEQAARQYWSGQNPIGKFIGVNYTGPGRVGNSTPRMRQIVGVVQGMKHSRLELPTEPAVYMPYLQDETYHDMATMSLFVRSVGDPRALDSSIRARILAVRPDQPVDAIQMMDDVLSQSLTSRRYSLSLLAAFAALALLLSAVGIYGVVSYAASQRTREFGIRIAVGAPRASLTALVFRQGMVLTLVGCLAGVGASLLLTRALEHLLFEVSPLDAASFVLSVVLLGMISAIACIVPAVRAAHVEPMTALRTE
ncbi:MAG: ABC transporter permease [Terracidiphilus sp.]